MAKKDKKENTTKTNINWYPGHMAKTKRLIKENLQFIDCVYEVIDARIPMSSRIVDLDDYIRTKPRIIIMSKSDLCDPVETKKWIQYYEKQGHIVLSMDILHNTLIKDILEATKKLMKKANEKREEKGMNKKRTRVLIVGIPNVGKSTLINRLVGKKAVNVGNRPGITKNLSWIRIHEEIELLDTPGILWPKFEDEIVAFNLASLTAIKEEVLPIDKVVWYILTTLEKYYPELLLERYGIESLNDDFYEVLNIIGKQRGCLVRGGIIDEDKVCNVVMNDLREGHIKGITFDRYIDESR